MSHTKSAISVNKFLLNLFVLVTTIKQASSGGGYGPPLPPGGGGGGGGGGFGGSGGSFLGDVVTLQLQSLGAIRGRRFQSAPRPPLGIRRPFLAFRGIPYAKPPSGMYRFREPRPYGSWGGTLEATEFKRPCPQVDPVTGSHIGDEDCLYLNVFVPEVVFGGPGFGPYAEPIGGIPLPLEPPIGFPPYTRGGPGGQGYNNNNNNNKKGFLRPFLGGIPKKRGKNVPFDPFRAVDDALEYPHNIQEILRNFESHSGEESTNLGEHRRNSEPPRRRTGKVRFPRSAEDSKQDVESQSTTTEESADADIFNQTSAKDIQARSASLSKELEAELIKTNSTTNSSSFDDDSIMVAEARAPPLPPAGGGIGGLGAPGALFGNPRPNTLLPVMVFIHGPGAFVAGSSQQFGPQPLMRHDVILVTFDHRLGVLGFLSTNDRENPGNWGLLDQIEALKWVKQNIAAFGGDPQRITVFGHQAGAASAHILMLSPRARGLFDQVILQSGSSICDWAIENRPFDYARRVGQEVHCRDPWESDDLMDCLEDAPITRILDAQEELMKYGYLPYRAAPVVDKGCRDDPVLPDDPYQLLLNGQFNRMPMIVGTTQDEGLLQFLMTYLDAGEEARSPEHLRTRVLPWLVQYMMKNDRELDVICDAIFEQYFNQTNFGDQDSIIRSFSNMITDSMFESCKQETLRLHARNGGETKIYSYVFSYRDYGTPSFSDKYIREAQAKGLNSFLFYTATSGGDDLLYLFNYIHAHNLNFGFGSQLDEIVLPPLPAIHASIDIISNTMTTYWTKFAEQGRLGYIGPILNGQMHLNWPPVDEFGNGNLNLTIQNYPMLSEYKPMVASYWYRTLPLVRHFGHKIWRGEAFEIVAWVFVALFLLLLIIVIALSIVLCCMRRKRMYKQPLRKTTLASLREPSSD